MADRPEYKSKWTGKQVDDAVGKASNALTEDAIVQTLGSAPNKVVSQVAITAELQKLGSQQDIDNAIAEHNESEDAHPYIQGLVDAKPNALNDRSESQSDTYSAKYINDSFAPITYVSNLWATKTSENTADLTNNKPNVSNENIITITGSTNTDYDWTAPILTFTRDLEVETTLTQSNSFSLNLEFKVNRNANISWGARIKVSQDNGQTWTYISGNQAYGATTYQTGIGNTAILQVYTNSLVGSETYPIGTLLAIEIYKKQATETALTTEIYCGVEVDGAEIYTYTQFNFSNINLGSDQIADGAVTYQKLSNDLQKKVDNINKKQIMNNYNTANAPHDIGQITFDIYTHRIFDTMQGINASGIRYYDITPTNTITYENVYIGADGFKADQTYADFPFKATVSLKGIDWGSGGKKYIKDNPTEVKPEVVFSVTDSMSGDFAPVALAEVDTTSTPSLDTISVSIYATKAREVTIPLISVEYIAFSSTQIIN